MKKQKNYTQSLADLDLNPWPISRKRMQLFWSHHVRSVAMKAAAMKAAAMKATKVKAAARKATKVKAAGMKAAAMKATKGEKVSKAAAMKAKAMKATRATKVSKAAAMKSVAMKATKGKAAAMKAALTMPRTRILKKSWSTTWRGKFYEWRLTRIENCGELVEEQWAGKLLPTEEQG